MQHTEYAPQGSAAWKMQRLSHVTCSHFADVLTEPRTKAAKEKGELSQTAEAYLDSLLGESLTGRPSDTYDTFAMKWGRDWEPSARENYEWKHAVDVVETGFIQHPTERLVGGSPDGLIGDDGILEVKAPLNIGNHVRVIRTREVPDDHVAQIQGLLWVTDRKWCDFASYHPHCLTPQTVLVVVRVERDEEFIVDMAEKVVRFRDRLLDALSEMGGKHAQ